MIMNDFQEQIEKNMQDIRTVYPKQLTLAPKELANLRGISIQTLARERNQGIGPAYLQKRTTIEYPIREVAKWLAETIKTS